MSATHPAESDNGNDSIFLCVVPPAWPPRGQMQTINSWLKFHRHLKVILKAKSGLSKVVGILMCVAQPGFGRKFGGTDIPIFVFTDLKNNRFQKKLMMQTLDPNIRLPPQVLTLATPLAMAQGCYLRFTSAQTVHQNSISVILLHKCVFPNTFLLISKILRQFFVTGVKFSGNTFTLTYEKYPVRTLTSTYVKNFEVSFYLYLSNKFEDFAKFLSSGGHFMKYWGGECQEPCKIYMSVPW